jgi:hypothetical protein
VWKSSGFSRANSHLDAASIFVVGKAGSDGPGDGARAPGSPRRRDSAKTGPSPPIAPIQIAQSSALGPCTTNDSNRASSALCTTTGSYAGQRRHRRGFVHHPSCAKAKAARANMH